MWFPKEYPGDGAHILPDEDRNALLRVYAAVQATIDELAPHFQVIAMEHADLEEQWFQDAVRYRWRERGEALIPVDWLESE